MFSVATIFLVAFALNLQGAVYGSSSVTPSLSSTYSSISSSPTSSTSVSGQNTTTSSPTQTPSTTALSQNATMPTSATSSEPTSTSGTASPSNETTPQPTATQPSKSKKTCASVTATLKKAKSKENVEQILELSFFKNTTYEEVTFTNVSANQKEISFSFCVKVNPNEKVKVESDTESQLKKLLDATEVTVEITGVKLTKWEATDAECDKCSSNGGPFKIERKCTDGDHSCKGVKTTDETDDCDKYCTKSGAVSFMVWYLLVAMGIALSLSFYL